MLLLLALPLRAEEVGRIVYLGLAEDPLYEPHPGYTGLALRDVARPLDGVRLAFRDTRVLGRALGVAFALDEVLLEAGADPGAAVGAASDALAVILDLPAEAMGAAVAAAGPEALLINIRDRGDRWRGADCAAALVHTIPSEAMLADALAQLLRARNWPRVLLLHGDGPEDLLRAEAARRAVVKFGLTLAGDRQFALTNDPRRRDEANVALLTGGVRHDVIWLVDSEGEFGRYLPYATYEARPVIGSEGLTPRAWHWTFERYGAPQLNQRFRRLAGRDMTSEDWAGWAAVRAVVEAVTRTRSVDPRRGAGGGAGAGSGPRPLQGRARLVPALGRPAAPADPAGHA